MRRALLALPLLLAGCGRVPCGQVGRAIADRTLTCEGSSDMAIGRARALQLLGTCPDGEGWWDPFGMPQRCVSDLEALECEEVRALGDDLEAWLATSEACAEMALTGGAAGTGGGTGGGGVDSGADGDDTGGGGSDAPPCSDPGGAASALAITNDSSTAVDIFWVAEDCSEVIQVTLARTESTEIGTYVGHAFVARELTGARAVVDSVKVSQADAEAWSVSD